jgi:hypothetical protein
MPEMTHSSTMATKSPPALEPTKDHEALRISSIELSNAAAQAFDKMDRDMCSSDAEILDEFRKMRGLFAELAKGDASLFTESKTSQEDRPADRESQQQGKEVLRHSDVLRQKVQRAISAAEALRELEASKPTPHQPSLAILQEAIDSLRDLLSVKESFGGLGVNQRQVQIGKYKSTTGELVLRFLDHHFFFSLTNQVFFADSRLHKKTASEKELVQELTMALNGIDESMLNDERSKELFSKVRDSLRRFHTAKQSFLSGQSHILESDYETQESQPKMEFSPATKTSEDVALQGSIAIQKALALSIKAASAFEEMDENMVNNDEVLLDVLHEIKSSCRMLSAGGNNFINPSNALQPSPEEATRFNKADMRQEFEQVLSPTPPIRSMNSIRVETDRYSEEARKIVWEKAVQLSHDAADALDVVTETMSRNDNTALDVLRQIGASFRKIASAEDKLIFSSTRNPGRREGGAVVNTQQAPLAPQNMPTDRMAGERHLSKETLETDSIDSAEVLDSLSLEAGWGHALALSREAARLLEKVDNDMTRNDIITYQVLNEIRNTLQEFTSSRQESSAEIPHHKRTDATPQVPQLPSVTLPSDPSIRNHSDQISAEDSESLKSEQQMWEKALQLSVNSAKALENANAAMVAKDQSILAELREIRSSFHKLASVRSDFYACFEGPKHSNTRSQGSARSPSSYSTLQTEKESLPITAPHTGTTETVQASSATALASTEAAMVASSQPSTSSASSDTAAAQPATPWEDQEYTRPVEWSLGARSVSLPAQENTSQNRQVTQRQQTQIKYAAAVEEMGDQIIESLDRRLDAFEQLRLQFKELVDENAPSETAQASTQPPATSSAPTEIKPNASRKAPTRPPHGSPSPMGFYEAYMNERRKVQQAAEPETIQTTVAATAVPLEDKLSAATDDFSDEYMGQRKLSQEEMMNLRRVVAAVTIENAQKKEQSAAKAQKETLNEKSSSVNPVLAIGALGVAVALALAGKLTGSNLLTDFEALGGTATKVAAKAAATKVENLESMLSVVSEIKAKAKDSLGAEALGENLSQLQQRMVAALGRDQSARAAFWKNPLYDNNTTDAFQDESNSDMPQTWEDS